jgi:hypothetical protein
MNRAEFHQAIDDAHGEPGPTATAYGDFVTSVMAQNMNSLWKVLEELKQTVEELRLEIAALRKQLDLHERAAGEADVAPS